MEDILCILQRILLLITGLLPTEVQHTAITGGSGRLANGGGQAGAQVALAQGVVGAGRGGGEGRDPEGGGWTQEDREENQQKLNHSQNTIRILCLQLRELSSSTLNSALLRDCKCVEKDFYSTIICFPITSSPGGEGEGEGATFTNISLNSQPAPTE